MADQTASVVDVAAATLTDQINKANALATKISAATSDKGNLVADIRDNEPTDDATVLAFREWYEKAKATIEDKIGEINGYITDNLMPKAEEIDVDALKSQYAELKASITGGLKFLQPLGFDPEAANLPALKSLRGGTANTGGKTDTRRPRVNDITVDGKSVAQSVKNAKTGEVQSKASFSYAAAYLSKQAEAKVEVSDLQQAAFAAAKTDDLKSLNGEPFDFHYEVNGKTFDVKVWPRSADEKSAPASE